MPSFEFPFESLFDVDTPPEATAVVTVDHVAIALSRLCKQFRSDDPINDPANRTNMEKLIIALATPANDLELALQQLLQLRTIAVGNDATLAVIGRIVGQERGTLAIEDYRRYLFARIATNHSAGKRRDIIKISHLILNDSGTATIQVQSQNIATSDVRVNNIAIASGLADILFSFLSSAVEAGVRLILETSASPPGDTFTFDSGPGFDVGAFADARG